LTAKKLYFSEAKLQEVHLRFTKIKSLQRFLYTQD